MKTEPLMCGRCYDECDVLYPARCPDPRKLAGAAIGQYHCECGAMVIAGLPHPELCALCIERVHPHFDELSPGDAFPSVWSGIHGLGDVPCSFFWILLSVVAVVALIAFQVLR